MARIANPAITSLAGTRWLPGFGVLVHKGRRSGRILRTPVGMGVAEGCFFIPLTFGTHSHWFQNVVAASEYSVRCRGVEYQVGRAVVVESARARHSFPIALWWLLRAVGIRNYLLLEPTGG
ncbi:MAG: nitroreductase/quinone reductase family protein [Candidatus Dormibacterales bacterium]